MSWRDTLAESLGYPRSDSGSPKTWGHPPVDKLDNMDQISEISNSVHSVHSVRRLVRSHPLDKSPRASAVHKTLSLSEEIGQWPLETQRLFVALLNYWEARGHILAEAEVLAYANIKELDGRKRDLAELLPDELKAPVQWVQEVFGPGVQVKYRCQVEPVETSTGVPNEDGTLLDGTH